MNGQGFGMPMTGMQNPMMFANPGVNMNMMNPFMIGGNWMNIYSNMNNMNNMNNIINNMPFPNPQGQSKINVIFKTTMGVVTNVLIDYGKTMSDLFQVYLKRVDKIELYNTKDTILFLFNAKKLSFTDNTKVEDFFKLTPNPTIVVNDVKGLIGA